MLQTWTAARKESENKFSQAYKAWTDNLLKEAGAGNKAAKDKIVMERLKISGLYKGAKFTSYCSFKSEFGTMLDKIEAMGEANATAAKKLPLVNLALILQNKKLFTVFKHFCDNSAHVSEVLAFINGGSEKQPQVIYDTFIKKGATLLLNLDDDVVSVWDKMAASKNWAPAKASIKQIYLVQKGYLENNVKKLIAHKDYKILMIKELGGADPVAFDKLADKCLATAVEYAREVQGYGKRWSKMQPDFWTPLNKALNEIIETVNKYKGK